LLLRNRKKKQAGRDGVGVSKSIEQAKNNQKAINQKSKRPFLQIYILAFFLLVSQTESFEKQNCTNILSRLSTLL
jgi:hypothetical protein